MNSKFYTQALRIWVSSQKTITVVLLLIIFSTTYGQTIKQNYFNYTQAWAQVDTFYKNRFSKSALEEVNKIFLQAKSEKFSEQIIKCILVRKNLNNTIERDPLSSIAKLKSEIDSSSFPLKPVLYSLLADEYLNYYTRNSYNIDKRADITTKSDSIAYWGKCRFQQEIIRYLKLSLYEKEKLQQMPIELINELVTKEVFYGNGNITLYDLLAQQTLEILSNYSLDRSKESVLDLLKNPAIFGSANAFSGMSIKSSDTLSTIYLSIKLYQDLLRFHKKDSKTDLFLSYNLERLQYFNIQSLLENKDSLYNQALVNIKNQYPTHPISAEIDYLFATNTYNKNYRQKAIDLCQTSMNRFQNNDKIPGVCKCQSMITFIKQSLLSVEYEPITIPDEHSKINISYVNFNHLYARIFQLSIDEAIQIHEEADTIKVRDIFEMEFANRKFVKKFDIPLPKNNDYQIKKAEILIPALSPGYYYIWFSDNPDFNPNDVLQYITEQQTNISFTQRTVNRNLDQLYVFNRKTGQPLSNATIIKYQSKY